MMDDEVLKFSQQTIEHVDATPDAEYPLRILKVYRANCDCRFQTEGLSKALTEVYGQMNRHCERRAVILDAAIAVLERDLEADHD